MEEQDDDEEEEEQEEEDNNFLLCLKWSIQSCVEISRFIVGQLIIWLIIDSLGLKQIVVQHCDEVHGDSDHMLCTQKCI